MSIAVITGLAFLGYCILQGAYVLDHFPYCGGRKWWWRFAEMNWW